MKTIWQQNTIAVKTKFRAGEEEERRREGGESRRRDDEERRREGEGGDGRRREGEGGDGRRREVDGGDGRRREGDQGRSRAGHDDSRLIFASNYVQGCFLLPLSFFSIPNLLCYIKVHPIGDIHPSIQSHLKYQSAS